MKRPADSAAGMQLFCFPYAGGGASVFRDWQAELGPAIQVVPVQLPGREMRVRERPLTSVPVLAATLASEIAPAIRGPFAFFGYSFGCLLAFETARLLRSRGLTPEHLVVAALAAPQLTRRGRRIHDLPPKEFEDEIRKLKGTPEPVLRNPELMELVLPKIRADFAAYETYEYQRQAALACPISVMGGASDGSATPAELEAWGEHSSGGFRVRIFPGDHFFIHTAPRLLTWAILQDLLGPLRKAC
jgi:medium-chain acyl-[acyl-carrier-protein] hydrolase